MTNIINKPVHVTAMRFSKNLIAYPSRIECEGKTYEFVDAGPRLTIRNRDSISQILTLSDGFKQFRLRGDGRGSVWTLLSISAA